MAIRITRDCIMCGACLAVCPTDAISEGMENYIINPDLCIECVTVHDTPQCVEVCPVDTCEPDPDHKETKNELEEKYRLIREGRIPGSR